MIEVLQKRMQEVVEERGGIRPAARWLGCGAPHVMRILAGEVEKPGDKLLGKLGLVRSVVFQEVKK